MLLASAPVLSSGTTGRTDAGEAKRLLSVCKVLNEDSAVRSMELTVVLMVAAVPVAVLHSRES